MKALFSNNLIDKNLLNSIKIKCIILYFKNSDIN